MPTGTWTSRAGDLAGSNSLGTLGRVLGLRLLPDSRYDPHGKVLGNSGKSFPQRECPFLLRDFECHCMRLLGYLSNVLLVTYKVCENLMKAPEKGNSGSAIALDQVARGCGPWR